MFLSLTVGANKLEINGGNDEIIFGVVKAWLDAVTGDDKTQASIDRAAEALKAHNDKLADVVDANTPPPS